VAFDTGPGNMIIDALAQELFGKRFDRNGGIAARGKVLAEVLSAALGNPYFKQRPRARRGASNWARVAASFWPPVNGTATGLRTRWLRRPL